MSPAYDFECQKCGTITEIHRSMIDDSPVPCPECGGKTLQKYRVHVRTYPVKNVRARMNGKVLWEA